MRRLPAHIVNGIVVALGAGLALGVFGALGGRNAAQVAIAGAVCANLPAVRLMLARSSAVLENPQAAAALSAAKAELDKLLTEAGATQPPPPLRPGLAGLPRQPPGRDLLPWLERRPAVAIDEAHEERDEAQRLLARLTDARP